MAKFEVFPELEVKDVKFDPEGVQDKVRQGLGDFFPDWVLTTLLGLAWLFVLPAIMIILGDNLVGGLMASVGLVLACVLACYLYPTYSPSYRTIGWAMVISFGFAFLTTKMGDFPYKMLVVIVPTGLFVIARVNMNLRKLLYMVRR